MRKELTLNLERETTTLTSIANRLKHKKDCKTDVPRVRNKLVQAIERANQLLQSGELQAEGEILTITTEQELLDYLEAIKRNGEYVLDLETSGLDVFNDIIVGVCLYTPNMPSAYVPINHTDLNNNRLPNQLNENLVRKHIRKIFSDETIRTITHNGKFDGKVAKYQWELDIANYYFDTLIGAHILNENEPHGLKELHFKYIQKGQGNNFDYSDYFGNTPFNYIPIEVASVYGGNDGYKTYALYKFQSGYLDPNHKREDFRKLAHVLFDIEMPLIPILINMELRGINLRKDYSAELAKTFNTELKEVKKELDRQVGEIRDQILANETLNRLTKGTGVVNFSSPQQLSALFYDVLKFPSVDRKNPRGTGEDILKKISAKVKGSSPFIETLLRYREVKKLLTTYVEKLPKNIEPKTGYLHGEFNQIGTVTGRFSSQNPNLQNIPAKEKRIRKMFSARDGYVLIGADFSQIEPRTLAYISQDQEMIKAYNEGRDLYALMASKIYNLPPEECMEFRSDGTTNPEGKKRRDSVKSVLLGIMYERGASAIAEQFGQSTKWAEELVDNFLKTFPAIEQLRVKVIHQAETYGYVNTLDGRKRRLPDMRLTNKEDYRYKNAHRQCLNAVIQGTAGDIMKLAIIRVANNSRLKELDAHILLTIHDELIIEAPEEHAKEASDLLVADMVAVAEGKLHLKASVDAEITKIWTGEPYQFPA